MEILVSICFHYPKKEELPFQFFFLNFNSKKKKNFWMRTVFYFPKKKYFCVCDTGLASATKIFFQDILMMSPGGTSSSAVFQMF